MKIDFETLLAHQRAFNELVWRKRSIKEDEKGVIDRLRHLCVGAAEEIFEFLRTYDYKVHRRQKLRLQNVAHSHEELMDMFKYWLSIADVAEFPFDRLDEIYYAKSRVVQYRFQEEWLQEINGPSVVVDLDEVLADYITGMCDWATTWGPSVLGLQYLAPEMLPWLERLEEIKRTRSWLNHETVGMSHMDWQRIKHSFRTQGGKASLPVFDDAQAFLRWCKSNGWLVILITSRPVSDYPNILTDTMTWLHKNDLPFDYLWWTSEKTERLEEAHISMRSQIKFAVDDSARFVGQFSAKGVPTYWLVRGELGDPHMKMPDNVTLVRSLSELMQKEMER